MKKLLLLLIMLGFAVIACKEDDSVRPFVNITANLTNSPDYTAGVWQVPLPQGEVMEVPKAYKTSGNCDYMEGIDPEHSYFSVSDVVWDPLILACRGVASITLQSIKGDKLYLEGEYFIYPTYYNEAFFHFNGGTGKFDGSEGWMKSTGQCNIASGHNFLDAAGKICAPKPN